MNDNHQEEYKENKTSGTTESKPKFIFIQKIIKILVFIKNIFNCLITKLDIVIKNRSIITQFILVLIPLSIICLLFIFIVHIYFFINLYSFNFYKGIKEEFLDNYVTQMDDLHSELDTFIAKEHYIDTENQIFFQVYFKELSSIGLLNNPNKRTFPNININSEKLYLGIDKHDDYLGENIYTIPKNISKNNIDDRKVDSIGEFAKIYYYMFPIIAYGAFKMNIIINQSFFIGYEFDKNNNREIKNNELFFKFPRSTNNNFYENDNFIPNDVLLNPLINNTHFKHTELVNNSYYKENWFMKQDNIFRESIDDSQNGYSEISLANLNKEYNGKINKSIIISSQQYIKSNNRHYIINIIFFLKKNNLNKDTVEYSTFIVKNNPNFEKYENEKYSDNETFVILKSDIFEYSLINSDYQYFHNGLYEKNYNFFLNGISFDSFNLDFLYNPLEYYSTIEDFDIDLKYFSTLYLYKSLFQSLNYSKIQKNREEIYLFNFNDERKVQNICSVIDFKSYQDFYKKSNINCWSKENSIYYDENNYINLSMIDIYSIYPYCSCLPLFCLENYESINNNYNDVKLASKINLPNKCRNLYISYEINSSSYNMSNSFSSDTSQFDYEYIKFQFEPLEQLEGYHFFIITKVVSNVNLYIYEFYTLMSFIEITISIFLILGISLLISILIMCFNIRRYSLIIKEFKRKYELYVLDSEDENIINFKKTEKNLKYKNKIIEEYNNEYSPLLQNDNLSDKSIYTINDNSLLDDLFSMFCKHYKLSMKNIEQYFLKQKHETKNQMKLKMMMEKNELFKLLAMFSVLAPIFRLNLSLDYKMYNYTKIMKKYDKYISQILNINKEQTRLTQNILYELLSTENISDYGLVSNLNFKYISNIKAEFKENCIQNSIFKNVINKMKDKNEDLNENDMNINDVFLLLKDGDEKQNIKLILKEKNELMELFRNKFEVDDYINFNKIENSFNFFLINSYYKYLKQIVLEGNNN